MSQFSDESFGNPPPKKKSNTMMIVLIVVGVVVVLPLICCGVMSLVMYSGFNAAMAEGSMKLVEQVAHTPPMEEHIGELKKAQINLVATGQRAARTGEDGVVVADVEGSKGKGVVLLEQTLGDLVVKASLELPDGRTFPLIGHDDGMADDGEGDGGF
jgi:flagellar basal body-associated protein FliL